MASHRRIPVEGMSEDRGSPDVTSGQRRRGWRLSVMVVLWTVIAVFVGLAILFLAFMSGFGIRRSHPSSELRTGRTER